MKSFTLQTETQDYEFVGFVLGTATSEAGYHNHEGDFLTASAPPSGAGARRQKCSACRWLETTIYQTKSGHYVIHTNGRSIVPGERDYVRVTFTQSAYEVVEILTVKGQKEPFIPAPSARALAQAADKDDSLQEAYVNRAVYR